MRRTDEKTTAEGTGKEDTEKKETGKRTGRKLPARTRGTALRKKEEKKETIHMADPSGPVTGPNEEELTFFTVTGMGHYYGTSFLERGMKVFLIKDTGNSFDSEAIAVALPGLGKIGYVANSTSTVKGDCISAGRLYDRMGDTALGTVFYVLPEMGCAVCLFGSPDEEED